MPRRTARQRAASRRNLQKARRYAHRHRRKIAVGVGAGVVLGTAIGAYSLDRKRNTMVVYHGTTHARARKIAKEGYKTRHRKRAYGNAIDATLHESGKAFFSTREKSIRQYGPAIVTARVRKKKFYKYARQDIHPKSRQLESMGIVHGHRYKSHYNVPVGNLRKAGIKKIRYTKQARRTARKRIYNRYEQGSYRSFYE